MSPAVSLGVDGESARGAPAGRWTGRPFVSRVLSIVLLAGVLRIIDAVALAPPLSFLDDDTFFKTSAQLLGQGHGYIRPLDFLFHGQTISTAEHPPLYPLILSILPALGTLSLTAARMFSVVFGCGTVVVVALIGRRVAGEWVGLVAALLCAVYPSFIAADGSIMSEPLFGLLVGLVVLQALRLRERRRMVDGVLLGVLIGLATLTRSEALVLLVLVGVPAVVGLTGDRLRIAVVMVLAALVVLAPWVGRNWHVFGRPTLSTNEGTALAGSNCPGSYHGPETGGFDLACAVSIPLASKGNNEARWASALTRRGATYAGDHLGRLPAVVLARVGRVLGLYRIADQNRVTGRRKLVQQAGVIMYYVLLVLAVIGFWSLRRRVSASEKWILLAPFILTIVVTVTTYGDARFRYESEVMLMVLAASGLSRLRPTRKPAGVDAAG